MAVSLETGSVQITTRNGETHIDWRIENFFAIIHENIIYHCPTFCFADGEWCLRLWTHNFLNPDSMGLFLESKTLRKYTLDYNFGVKKPSDCTELLLCGTLKPNQYGCGSCNFVKRSELVRRRFEIAPCEEAVTLKCLLRGDVTKSHGLEKSKSFAFMNLDRLSEKFRGLFSNKETCDTTLKVKNKEYKAHRAVLIAQSPVFAAMFAHDTSEKKSGVINIPDCDPDFFQEFLEYLYCGKLEEISCRSALHLYVTSDKYEIQELKPFCVEYLTKNLSVENACEVVAFAEKYNETDLFSAVQIFFNENACKIFETSDWEYLMKSEPDLANKVLKEMAKVKLSQ